MPKKKYIAQPELCAITDHQLLMQRQQIIELIHLDRFKFMKNFKDSEETLFDDIKDILDKAPKKDRAFIKNYFMLSPEFKADVGINETALEKNPYIYFLIDHDIEDAIAVAYAEILMQTDGTFFHHIKPDLVDQSIKIPLNAVISAPSVFKYLPTKYKTDDDFIAAALKGNPLIYMQLTNAQRMSSDFLKITLQRQPINLNLSEWQEQITEIYTAIPNAVKNDKSKLHFIVKLQPKIYAFLLLKYKDDPKIATEAVKRDLTMIEFVPKIMHFASCIITAYFSHINTNILKGSLPNEFKRLTGSRLNHSELVNKFIAALPRKEIANFASLFGSQYFSPKRDTLSEQNICNLLNKDPRSFKNLSFISRNPYRYKKIINLAIRLDYLNFKDLRMAYLHKSQYLECLKLAIQSYRDNGSKGMHPYANSMYLLTIEEVKQVITHKINGIVTVDYETIFKFAPANVKRNPNVYLNALNTNPNLASYYPITKSCKSSIFKGLNIAARKTLFNQWIKRQDIKDVLEIAHLKQEILKPTTQSVVKVS